MSQIPQNDDIITNEVLIMISKIFISLGNKRANKLERLILRTNFIDSKVYEKVADIFYRRGLILNSFNETDSLSELISKNDRLKSYETAIEQACTFKGQIYIKYHHVKRGSYA